MKRLSILCMLLVTITWSIPSQAQFLKKLKKAVSNTVSTVSTEINTDDNAGGNPTGGLASFKATHANLSAYHPFNIYSLKPGEQFDFTESCLDIHADITIPQIVIIKNSNRFLIGKEGSDIPVNDNNIKGCTLTGSTDPGNIINFDKYAYNAPNVNADASKHFEDLYVHSSNGIPESEQKKLINADTMNAKKQAQMGKLGGQLEKEVDSGSINMSDVRKFSQTMPNGMRKTNLHFNKDSAGTFIVFNHKRYGSFAYVQSMMINKAKNKFVAVVTPGDPDDPLIPVSNESLIITSDGAKIKNSFLSATLVPFGDFNHYRLLITDNNGKEFLYAPATGQRISIPDDETYNLQIDKTTGAIVQLTDSQIYVDGKPVREIPSGVKVDKQHLYISQDHKHCAFWTFKGLFLPDGKMIDGVLSCKDQVKDGKNILSWIVLGKDNKTLILCHKEL